MEAPARPYDQFKTGKEAVDAAPKTGISAIVVGAGIGGLTCAVELALNGHSPVTVYESVKTFARLGDTIGIMPNAGLIIGRWPQLFEKLDPLCGHSRGIAIRRWDGKHIVDQMPPPITSEAQRAEEEAMRRQRPMFDCHRGDLHFTLLDYAKAAGVIVKQGIAVDAYDETEDDAAVIVNGERISADIVIGADGVKSKAREIVLGYYDTPKSTGYAIYRAFFSGDLIRNNPVCAHLVEGHVDQRTVWIGPDIHFIAAGVKDTKEFSWVMTHLDDADVTEGWSAPGRKEDALRVAAGWDPVVLACIESTPTTSLLDWKLVGRPPLPTWISPKGRIALLGDAAHPFLPTSIQGASQAMEDGTTMAHVLKLAGKGDIPTATRVYQELRYDRVKETQELGRIVRDTWHKIPDWENIDPEKVKLPQDFKLFGYDAAQVAQDDFESTKARLSETKPKAPVAQIVKDTEKIVLAEGAPVAAAA